MDVRHPVDDTLGPATPRVLAEWAARVQAEYTSAAVTARLVHLSIATGLPRPVVDTALRIVADELDHAELSHVCLCDLGGAEHAVSVDLDQLLPTGPRQPLAEAVTLVLRSFCFGETLAVPLFRALRECARHPTAVAALDRIVRDEVVHRAFGWTVLDALLERDPEGVRALSRQLVPALTTEFRETYGELPPGPALTPGERAMGLMDRDRWRTTVEAALVADVGPRLARRGLHLID